MINRTTHLLKTYVRPRRIRRRFTVAFGLSGLAYADGETVSWAIRIMVSRWWLSLRMRTILVAQITQVDRVIIAE